MTIKIIGVGDAGSHFANDIYTRRYDNPWKIITLNTVYRYDEEYLADEVYIFNDSGLGTGGNPMIGRQIAEKNKDFLYNILADAQRILITAGMGGGTGTGASHVIAYIASELHIPTSAVVSTPFSFEGQERHRIAQLGIKALQKFVDELIVLDGTTMESVLNDNRASMFGNISLPLREYYTTLQIHMIFDILRALP